VLNFIATRSLGSKRKLCSSATRAGAPKVLDEKVLDEKRGMARAGAVRECALA